jgi:cell division protease FtsH
MAKPKKAVKSPGPKQLSKTLTRIHEAGHVVVAWFDAHLPKIKKVTVKSGEGYLGFAQIKWKRHHSQMQGIEETRALIRFFLGGRMTEKICGGPKMFGASYDLFQANLMAHFMVMGLGLSEEFGNTLPMFLPMGDRTKQTADDAMMKIMRECSVETERLLRKRRKQVMAVAFALQKKKTLKTRHLKKILGPRPKREIAPLLPEKKTNARRR